MQHNIRSAADQLIADRNHKRKLYSIVALLGLIVIFTVFYMLSLPAITIENEAVCGIEEHTHADGCYGDALTCDVADAEQAHNHVDECFETQTVGVCQTEEAMGHAHGDDCYADGQILACETEHEHQTDCYNTESALSCDETETPEHTHSDDCFATVDVAVCGYDDATEYAADDESALHVHDEECYTNDIVCGVDEHIHDELCYPSELKMLAAGMGIQSITSSDLAKFVVSGGITITDMQGNPIPDGVVIGENYLIKISFKEDTTGLQFANGELTYQLPDAIIVPDEQSGPILGNGDVELGWYEIATNGAITVTFKEVDDSGTATPGTNFVDHFINAVFNIELQAQFGQIRDGQEIEFGDNAIITIEVDDAAKLLVVKTATPFDRDNFTTDYTIEITALNGTIKLDKLVDVMSASGNDIAPGLLLEDFLESISIKKGDVETVVLLNELNVDWFTFELPLDGYTLQPNETLTVTYTIDLSAALEGKTGYNGAAINEVTVSGKDVLDIPITGDDEVSVPFKKEGLLRKTVDSFGESGNGTKYIKWHAYVGNGYTDLSGATITDIFGDGLIFSLDANTQIHVYDHSGVKEKILFGCDWQHHKSGWNHYHGDYSGNGSHALEVHQNQKGFTYSVPVTDEPIYYLEFVYYPAFEESDNPRGTFTNTISIDLKTDGVIDEEYTGTATVGPWDIDVDKTARVTNDYIEYTIEAFIPKSLHGQSLWIEDFMNGTYVDEKGNAVSVDFENLPVDFKVMTRKKDAPQSDNTLYDASKYTLLTGDDSVVEDPRQWFLLFAEDVSDCNYLWECVGKSRSPFDQDTTVTITYKIPLSSRVIVKDDVTNKWVVDTTRNMTLEDAMRSEQGGTYNFGGAYNIVNLPYYDSSGKWYSYTNDATYSTWPVHKVGTWKDDNDDNVVQYNVLITAGDAGVLASGDPLVAPVMTDIFDSRLEYVPGSFHVYRDDKNFFYAWGNWEWDDLVPNYVIVNGDGTSTLRVDFADMNTQYFMDGDVVKKMALERDWFAKKGASYYVEYKLRVKDEGAMAPGIIKLNNDIDISLTLDGKKENYDDDFTVEYGDPVVTKEMTESGNTASVEITINPNCLDLAQDSNTFEMRDKMSDTLAFYLSTIVVQYKGVNDDEWQKATLVQNGTGLWSYTTVGDNEISMVLPDNTAIVLTYKALIRGGDGQTVAIKNEVWVVGQYDSVARDGFVIAGSSANAGGSKGSIQIVKDDALHPEIHLDNATFALYAGYPYTGYDKVEPEYGADATIVVDGVTFYYVAAGVTGAQGHAKGTYTFRNNAIIPNEKLVYALVELVAPEGYVPPTSADNTTLIFFDELKAEQSHLTATKITDFVNISNTPYRAVLPATGGAGTVGYMMFGLALIGFGGVATLVRFTKKRA